MTFEMMSEGPDKMRILFLSRWFPYPPDNGSKIRIYNLLKGFYPDHQVDLITFFENEDIQEYIPQLCEVVTSVQAFPYKKFRPGGMKAILGFLSPYPRSVVDTYSEDIAAAVKKAVAEKSYDLLIASEIDMSIYARAVRGPRKIFEEIEITKLITQIKTENQPVRKLRSKLTWWKLSRYLGNILNSYDGCTVVSEAEQKAVQSVFQKYEPAVIPNGVDTRMITPNGSVDIEAGSMIFAGAITYEVNFQAVAYFIKEIFPLIRVKRPDAHLYVTGHVNQSLIDRLPSCDGVTFTGYLDDVRSMLTKCCVNVVPLTIGGGTRLKVLEFVSGRSTNRFHILWR